MPAHSTASRQNLHESKREKAPVQAASTGNVSLSTPGATLDGVTLAPGRILLKDQTTASQNGLYDWVAAGSALTRCTDASLSTDFLAGDQVYVFSGTANGGDRFTLTTSAAITLGTTALVYTRNRSSLATAFTQSSTAPALATSGTISTSGITETRVSPAAAVASIVLQAGTYGGQEVIVVNEASLNNSITFAASGTSNVAGGTGIIIQGGVSLKFVWDAGTSLWYCAQPVTPAVQAGGGTLIIDGGGQAITTGVKLDVEVPYNMTLTSNRLVADQSGSIVIDILRAAFGSFPGSATSICASARPTLSSAQTSQDTTLTGWTVTLLKGDWLRINVVSASTVQRVALALAGTRN